MSLVGYGYSSSGVTPTSGEKKKEQPSAEVSRRSSLLEPRKKYETPCFCTTEVDLEIFRGVFTDQWLHGRAYGNNEEIFFCTSCGPSTVQDELREVKHARGVSGETSNSSKGGGGSSPAPAKSTSAMLKKIFTFGRGTSSSSSGMKRQGSDGALASTPSGKESGKPPRHTQSSKELDEEELPVTPRSERELFLCVTCGACYCRDHARDHHYSRRHVETNVDADAPSKGYPYHSYFVGVPSYISTHKEHRLKETEWGLLLPTVLINEVQPYVNTLATSQHMTVKTPASADKKKAKSSLRLYNAGSGNAIGTAGTPSVVALSPISASPVLSKPVPFYPNFEELCDSAATRHLSAVHSRGPSGAGSPLSSSYTETPQFTVGAGQGGGESHHHVHSHTASHVTAADGSTATAATTTTTPTTTTTTVTGVGDCPLSPPCFYATPPDNWSLLVWCASCGERPTRFPGRHCDNEKDLHRHLRRLGQLLAVLAYFRRAGVQLKVPEAYLAYMDKKQAEQHARQMKQRKALSSVEAQRVGRATEGLDGVSASVAPTSSTFLSNSADNYYSESLYDRSSTDRIMTEAALAGFANPSFYCYVNSVFQCVLRCSLFCRPLLRPLVGEGGRWSMNGPLKLSTHSTLHDRTDGKTAAAATAAGTPSTSVASRSTVEDGALVPGKLTLSFVRLMDQLLHQTYQDVRNGAVYPFARTVFHQVCRVCPLFEEDTQQDSQEFLISLLNGVADEFDAGKSEAEKKSMKRISFEGVLRHEVVCASCFHRVPRDEMFMALSIPAKSSIEAGLKSVFEAQKLKGSDKYACEYCFKKLSRTEQASHNDLASLHQQEQKELAKAGKKKPANGGAETPLSKDCVYQEAEVHTIIARLGGTLAIHILRFQYDPELRDFAKVTAPVKIPLTLDLSPYVDTAVVRTYSNERSLFTLRQRFPELPEEALEKRLADSKWDCAAATRAMQEVLGDGGSPKPAKAEEEANASARPTSAVSSKSTIGTHRKKDIQGLKRSDFNPFGIEGSRCPSLQRQLVGIVAHRGSLHGGHYIAFVRSLSQPDVWFRCDDEDVDVVDEKTVLDCSSEVYLAFYE